jgi:hypothetical protein
LLDPWDWLVGELRTPPSPADHLGRPQCRQLLANGFDCQVLSHGRSSQARKNISPQRRGQLKLVFWYPITAKAIIQVSATNRIVVWAALPYVPHTSRSMSATAGRYPKNTSQNARLHHR